MRNAQNSLRRGLNLIEVLIGTVILGIMASVVIPQLRYGHGGNMIAQNREISGRDGKTYRAKSYVEGRDNGGWGTAEDEEISNEMVLYDPKTETTFKLVDRVGETSIGPWDSENGRNDFSKDKLELAVITYNDGNKETYDVLDIQGIKDSDLRIHYENMLEKLSAVYNGARKQLWNQNFSGYLAEKKESLAKEREAVKAKEATRQERLQEYRKTEESIPQIADSE